MDVTVVIPTFNRPASVLRCVSALSREIPVVVVDDGSSAPVAALLRELRRPHLTIARKRNGGPASARNLGVSLSKTELVAFTDDDCVPQGSWPQPLVDRLAREPPGVAGVGGRVMPLQGGLLSRYYTANRILEPPASCSYLVTANCAYRRSAILEAGGFDESLHLPGGEDPHLSRKVVSLGYSLRFEPRAVVRHEYREGLLDFATTFFRYGAGCGYVMGG
jgi:mycofactocin glycosyltransferase